MIENNRVRLEGAPTPRAEAAYGKAKRRNSGRSAAARNPGALSANPWPGVASDSLTFIPRGRVANAAKPVGTRP
jgi:hypothetical protein